MAPRRGGSGGGLVGSTFGSIGSGTSIHNACADDSALSAPPNIAYLVIDGLCLVFMLVIWVLWLRTMHVNGSIKRILPWYTFGSLLLLFTLALILQIVQVVLSSCFILDYIDSFRFGIALDVLTELSNMLVLGIILFPLTRHLLHRAGRSPSLATIINAVAFGLVAVLWLPALVLLNDSNVNQPVTGDPSPTESKVSRASQKVFTAYYFLYFISSVIGSVFLLFSLVGGAGNRMISTSTKLWTVFTLMTLDIGALAVVIDMFGWVIPQRILSDGGYIAFLVFFQFVFVMTIFGILQTAHSSTPQLVVETNTTYAPNIPHATQVYVQTSPGYIQPHPQFNPTHPQQPLQYQPQPQYYQAPQQHQ